MKSLFLLFILGGGRLVFSGGHVPPFIDPTGTYILKGLTEKNKIISHSGEIRVKLLDHRKVAMCFYINKGYPSYESGSFIDTLPYNNYNEAIYTPAADSDCTIIFYFRANSAETRQIYSNPESGCGFGKGVMVSAFFEKYSGAKPIIQDLSARGIAP